MTSVEWRECDDDGLVHAWVTGQTADVWRAICGLQSRRDRLGEPTLGGDKHLNCQLLYGAAQAAKHGASPWR